MAVTRDQVIAEAREWVMTPYRHQCDLKGEGCDCAGLLRGVAIALGLLPADYRTLPEAQPFLGYGMSPDGFSMMHACDLFLERCQTKDLQPGNIVLMSFTSDPTHTGILVDYRDGLGIVHSHRNRGKVVEHRLDSKWRDYIVASYKYRGVVA